MCASWGSLVLGIDEHEPWNGIVFERIPNTLGCI